MAKAKEKGPVNPRVPVYVPIVQERVDVLNARINAGDSSAYAELTHLAVLHSGLYVNGLNAVLDRVVAWALDESKP
jgi:hypothetical protein